MKKILFVLIPVILIFNSCALEVANVIGPGGGYVFFDKLNYDGGYRYIECMPKNAGEIESFDSSTALAEAAAILSNHSYGQYNTWELPTEQELKDMLRSLRWELTRFENSYQYMTVNGAVYRNNFDNSAFGEQEKIDYPHGRVYLRLIRRF